MGDYKQDQDEFFDRQALAALDEAHHANLKMLAARYDVSPDTVLEALKSPGKWIEREAANGEVISTDELRPLPEGQTDPELAEWAVRQLRDQGKIAEKTMGLYIVDVDDVRYRVNVKQVQPGDFEIQAQIAQAGDEADSVPTDQERDAFQRMIRELRRQPPTI